VDEIEKMLNSFWLGHNNYRGLHWFSWERLSVPKHFGGMGFKSLQAFNYVMLGKQAWKMVTNPGTLITKLFKAKYFPNNDFFKFKHWAQPKLCLAEYLECHNHCPRRM
jgi:hypothetical protein